MYPWPGSGGNPSTNGPPTNVVGLLTSVASISPQDQAATVTGLIPTGISSQSGVVIGYYGTVGGNLSYQTNGDMYYSDTFHPLPGGTNVVAVDNAGEVLASDGTRFTGYNMGSTVDFSTGPTNITIASWNNSHQIVSGNQLYEYSTNSVSGNP